VSPVPIGSDDGPGGGSYCGTAPASNRSTNDSATDSAAPCRTLRHDVRRGHRKREQEQDRPSKGTKHLKAPFG